VTKSKKKIGRIRWYNKLFFVPDLRDATLYSGRGNMKAAFDTEIL